MGDHETHGRVGLIDPTPDRQIDKPGEEDPDALAYGRWLFAQDCRFLLGAAQLDQVPDTSLPEVAFAGRSNVGKSSLVNALTGRRTLARTSREPGRTQQLNFFVLGERLNLVDLPGYGFAKAPKNRVAAWTDLVNGYLRGRPGLRRCYLLIDARHGLKDVDRGVMDRLDKAAASYQVVLTKCDKAPAVALTARMDSVGGELARRPAAHPRVHATSSRTGAGIPELQAAIAMLAPSEPLE